MIPLGSALAKGRTGTREKEMLLGFVVGNTFAAIGHLAFGLEVSLAAWRWTNRTNLHPDHYCSLQVSFSKVAPGVFCISSNEAVARGMVLLR